MMLFLLGCTLYCFKYKYKRLKYRYTGTLRLREVNFTRYGACTKQLARKRISSCSSFKTLSTDSGFKFGVFYKELWTLEFNFYFSHYHKQYAYSRMAEWQNGRMAEWQNGRTVEWQNGMALLGHRSIRHFRYAGRTSKSTARRTSTPAYCLTVVVLIGVCVANISAG